MARWHGRIALPIGVVASLWSIPVALDFASANRDPTFRHLPSFVLAVPTAAFVLVLIAMVCNERYPDASFFEAALRLLLPMIVLIWGCQWMLDQAIFRNDGQGWIGVAVVTVPLGAASYFAYRYRKPPALEPILPPPSAPAMGAGAMPGSFTPDGAVVWPDQPPAASLGASPPPPGPNALPLTISRPSRWRNKHLTSSMAIAALWIPLGLFSLLLFNWCPNRGAETATAVMSFVFVGAQLIGNPVGGWLLDRRYGSAGGGLLAVGRCLIVAFLLIVAFGFLSVVFIGGESRYCG